MDDRAEYEDTVVGDLSGDAAALTNAQDQLDSELGHQKAEEVDAVQAADQATQLEQENASATAQTEATLHQVKGTLAQQVAAAAEARARQEAAAAAAARSAAAAQAAAAQAAAAVNVAGAVGGAGSGAAAITAANQGGAAPGHASGGPTSSTPPTVAPSGGSSGVGTLAVRAAVSQLGVPYVWGGETPGVGFDCSGLTQWAWAQAGVTIPRTAASQYAAVPRVPLDALEPGDLLFYFNLDGDGIVDHVVMYVGSGPYGAQTIIQAPETGETVSYAPLYTFGLIGAGQP
ncbi:MAG: C40 family peptidase [Actinomycetota bacterium]|nr:C40 family peptidase [Actinomycetota bacterium]